MKMNTFTRITAFTVIFTAVITGCNKEEMPPAGETISFDKQEILDKVPAAMKSSEDQYAQQAVAGIESAVDMSSFIEDMDPPQDAVPVAKKSSGDTWKWTVSDGQMSYTFYWTYEEDNQKKYWYMDIQFGDGDRYEYIYAWESKDGKEGVIMYNFNWTQAYYGNTQGYEDLYWKYNWSVDDAGNYNFGWNYESGETDTNYYLQYDIVVNDDGSGSIMYYSMDELFYSMEWDAEGNGSWAYYSEGTESMSGNWTV